MNVRPATELLPPAESGRTYTVERVVRLGDVDTGAFLRLDGISRYLQDVATDDASAAGFPDAYGWVVRRTMIRVDRPAVLDEPIRVTTFCTGAGRSWAERRTSIEGERGAAIEAVSLWVQVDIATGRPARLGEEFWQVWGSSAGDRIVSSKLSLARPTDHEHRREWTFRKTDLDPFRHVNNAAHWSVVEQLLQEQDWPRSGLGELEFIAPVDDGVRTELAVDAMSCWVYADGRLATAARWTPAGS